MSANRTPGIEPAPKRSWPGIRIPQITAISKTPIPASIRPPRGDFDIGRIGVSSFRPGAKLAKGLMAGIMRWVTSRNHCCSQLSRFWSTKSIFCRIVGAAVSRHHQLSAAHQESTMPTWRRPHPNPKERLKSVGDTHPTITANNFPHDLEAPTAVITGAVVGSILNRLNRPRARFVPTREWLPGLTSDSPPITRTDAVTCRRFASSANIRESKATSDFTMFHLRSDSTGKVAGVKKVLGFGGPCPNNRKASRIANRRRGYVAGRDTKQVEFVPMAFGRIRRIPEGSLRFHRLEK